MLDWFMAQLETDFVNAMDSAIYFNCIVIALQNIILMNFTMWHRLLHIVIYRDGRDQN